MTTSPHARSLRTSGLVLSIALAGAGVPESADAQFALPLPKATDPAVVRMRDFQTLAAESWVRVDAGRRRWSDLRTILGAADATPAKTEFESLATTLCAGETSHADECRRATTVASMLDFFTGPASRWSSGVLVWSPIPTRSLRRPTLGRYVRESGVDDGFSLASQLAATVSNDAAYVATNVVRGLTGRFIFSADYAVVVAKSDTADAAAREAIEDEQSTLLRAINNGGSFVGRLATPVFVWRGINVTNATGLTIGGGFIGPLGDTGASDRKGIVSTTFESLSSIAIRGLRGDGEHKAAVIIGARSGYVWSNGALHSNGRHEDLGFIQGLLGLRVAEKMSVSALLTYANHRVNDRVPIAVVSFAANK